MMKKRFAGLLCAAFFSLSVLGQETNDKVLMTLGGEEVYLSEFLRVYNKNQGLGETHEQKNKEDYLDMFVNFKLKVKEAESLGRDTLPAFKRELDGYRSQLAKPYLIDSDVSDHLLKEAYQRLQSEVSASHILVEVDENASPADTLKAYKKALALRNKIMKGASFADVAANSSDDPSAVDNKGYLGYFTALYMVYPFESAAFNAPVGEVTMPVRTSFGYHLVLVHDKRAARGKVTVAHLMVKANEKMSEEALANAKTKIDELYVRLRNGESFSELAQMYSDDKSTSKRGGVLKTFGINEMVEPFEDASFSLEKPGDISKPIKTDYGWHIIQLKSKEELASFDEMKFQLETRIQKDSRAQLSKTTFIDRLKKEYGFKEYLKERNDFYKLVDASYFAGKWNSEKAYRYKSTMFVLDGVKYSQVDFTDYLVANQRLMLDKVQPDVFINKSYESFVEETIINYENERLEKKYPEFKFLMQEYRDGILLFELMGEKVWNKATRDTVGLRTFFNQHRDDYMWGERIDASIVSAASMKLAKKSMKYLNKGKSTEWILSKLNDDSQLNVSIERGLFAKGDDLFVDDQNWIEGAGEIKEGDSGAKYIFVHEKLAPSRKDLLDTRGMVIADYQEFLEKEWLKSLKDKYPVVINSEVLNSMP